MWCVTIALGGRMPTVFTINILGTQQVSRALSRYAEGIKDFTPAWSRIHQDFVQVEEQQFETQGARGGTPWAPLSPAYAAWKQKYFPGLPILQLTRSMWSQFAVGTGMLLEIKPLSLHMRPTLDYPIFHQRGTKRMPARRVVQLTEADKVRWLKILHNYCYDKQKEAGLA